MTKPRDLDCGPPPSARRDLDGAAHNDAIERRYGYSIQGQRAPLGLPRVGPDAVFRSQLEDLQKALEAEKANHSNTESYLREALAAAELRILELEQELSLK